VCRPSTDEGDPDGGEPDGSADREEMILTPPPPTPPRRRGGNTREEVNSSGKIKWLSEACNIFGSNKFNHLAVVGFGLEQYPVY
jgi:hypothetical protein